MFEKSLYSDISLVFQHPSYPFAMRYNVHKSIISQSPYFYKLLENLQNIPQAPDTTDQDGSSATTSLTIDLSKALTSCGFVLAPFQHIVRRKWQKTTKSRTDTNPILSCHLRFALQWMYSLDKTKLMHTIQDDDTLRILSISVLFDLHDLTHACVERYTADQLSLTSIMRDLETICQLPRGHDAYLQLRDASLLLLFRFGPENPARLAMLPVDYMADVLCSDLLFIASEFERYCLLRSVLMSFMQSVGKITWTPKGPVDQDAKRLSGFVRPMQHQKSRSILSATTVRARKRKRIPSEDLEDPVLHVPNLNRLSFTALVPFEKLVADASSGGVIDKATVLSYLLKTTVNYSNMTFDQLTNVRQDGIVDEGIVFRALWQREALERVLFPLTYHQQTQEQIPIHRPILNDGDRSAALNEYFDVDDSDAQENRRRLLLGTPRFRFRTSLFISPPTEENGWVCQDVEPIELSKDDLHAFDDDDNDENGKEDGESSDGSIWALSDNEEVDTLQVGTTGLTTATSSTATKFRTLQPYKIYQKSFYSEAETILGISYRVQIEAQVMPRHRLFIQDHQQQQQQQQQQQSNEDDICFNENVMVCRFELQRDKKQIGLPQLDVVKSEGKSQPEKNVDEGVREKTKIHYWIHCLNRHEGILENDRIDPEDRVLVAVTEQCEREHGEPGEMEPGYVGQVLINADLKKGTTIDATVALEIFGFQKV
ncbi:hypothetical protein INT48_007529 [Thamnidium elegans]|uniref:BTB domain-containing protein n=1 Tax=Thamnidium elegans TaxID=101142 RepID=A0A8H7VQY3_9FUNG|nr:hypothetical protein INT48_007529 [Thamnidium elegans]